MRKKNNMFQVCREAECDKKPVTAKTGNKEHIYCCEKGLEQSLMDFQEYLKKKDTNECPES